MQPRTGPLEIESQRLSALTRVGFHDLTQAERFVVRSAATGDLANFNPAGERILIRGSLGARSACSGLHSALNRLQGRTPNPESQFWRDVPSVIIVTDYAG